MRKFLTLLILTVSCSAVLAQAPRKPDRGFWFGEKPVKEEKKEVKKVKQTQIKQRTPLGPLPPYRELMKAHPEDLRQIFKERLEEVVWQTTPQNMYAYMVVKDVVRRKAMAVTQMHSLMLLKSPEFNMNTVRAVNTFARDAEVTAKMNEINRTLRAQRGKFALIYFRSNRCIYCKEQDQVMKFFQVKTGWRVQTIDIDKRPTLAAKLNVSMTPTVLLIKKRSDDYMPVAVGATSADEMSANIARATKLLDGKIDEQQFFMYEFDKGGLMDPTADPTLNVTSLMGVNDGQ